MNNTSSVASHKCCIFESIDSESSVFISSSSYYLWELINIPSDQNVKRRVARSHKLFKSAKLQVAPTLKINKQRLHKGRLPETSDVLCHEIILYRQPIQGYMDRYHEDSIDRRHTNTNQSKSQLQKETKIPVDKKGVLLAVLRKSNCFCPICVFLGLSAPFSPVLCHSQPFVRNVRFVVWFNVRSSPGHPRLPSAHM